MRVRYITNVDGNVTKELIENVRNISPAERNGKDGVIIEMLAGMEKFYILDGQHEISID